MTVVPAAPGEGEHAASDSRTASSSTRAFAVMGTILPYGPQEAVELSDMRHGAFKTLVVALP
ncbi:hypothetical protein Psuf_082250 [Phytohabitans suffuscus]|uniref:Uncharacterized protein n=1 Tax=Phytohabitans suffuscus TaxID=624315 RepID=A0A6F8YXV2_9ACTN|nr:hypothetical protein Psuf_082250 [Phytohabitans suffuscus]